MSEQQDSKSISIIKLIKDLQEIKLGLTLGILFIFWYFFDVIHYYPTGIDLNSGILAIFLSLGVGFLYLSSILIPHIIIAYLLTTPWQGLQPKIMSWLVVLPSLAFLFFYEYYYIYPQSDESYWWVTVTFLSIVILFVAFLILLPIYNNTNQQNESTENQSCNRERKNTAKLLFILGITPCLPLAFINIETVLSRLNIRQTNVSITLSEADYKRIAQLSKQTEDYFFTDCDNEKIMHNVDILWHGVGNESRIRIYPFNLLLKLEKNKYKQRNLEESQDTDKKEEELKKLKLEENQLKNLKAEFDISVKSEDLKIISTTKKIKEKCIKLDFPNIFSQGQKTIRTNDKQGKTKQENSILDKVKSIVSDSKTDGKNPTYKSLTISAFSDTTPSNSKNSSNYQLALQRAQTVRDLICGTQNNKHCHIKSYGSKYAVEKCDSIKNKEDLAHCQADDRKVEIKFHFDNQSNKTKETSTAS